MGGKKTGIYIDLANINQSGGFGMRFDVLRDFVISSGCEPARMNVYAVFNEERAKEDREYRDGTESFYSFLRDNGYKVIRKAVKRYVDAETGAEAFKANADLDMAVDLLMQAKDMDKVVLMTGDGDFTQVVRALQNSGIRVEIVAFKNISHTLVMEADFFLNGYLVPHLLPPISGERSVRWGEMNSRVRGVCYKYDGERGFGFMRYLIGGSDALWNMNYNSENSPWKSAFFHFRSFAQGVDTRGLPNRDQIFEFTLVSGKEGKPEAADIITVPV